ncbi:MAG: ABC transporter ATP-binding protein [Dehalococcoidales bacterium]|nr:ABC transporter ATP-binding protein [Dehalococcoidales bacterium]
MNTVLNVEHLKVRFNSREVIADFCLEIQRGRIYAIVGPNGSGKTTLLRAISRNVRASAGCIYLNGKSIFRMSSKNVARQMAVLSQLHNGMTDATVRELVAYGRFAHREWWQSKTAEDEEIISWSLARTNLSGYDDRRLNTLSGGERQRVWIAMAIAQKPQILLLDEPTTFLDIAHQIETLELIAGLNREEGITILMVLHDINHAAHYADELIVMKNGRLFSRGLPGAVITPDMMREVFGVEADIFPDPETGKPIVRPRKVAK